MVTQQDQLALFSELAEKLQNKITFYAFGGTAMMFYGYKEETKDIDLLFLSSEDRAQFIEALKTSGFHISSPFRVYIQRKETDTRAPIMYRKYDYRIDLFAGTIFRSRLSPIMIENAAEVHDFGTQRQLKLFIVGVEDIVYLKGITEREKDFEDIKKIVKKHKSFSWDKVMDEALWQHEHGDDWALIDTEKTLQQMKAYIEIDPKHLKRLYDVQRTAEQS
jgi:hypothetical protein